MEEAEAEVYKRPRTPGAIDYRLKVAKRVLEEYQWREQNLQREDVNPLAIEALAYTVAAECRSEVEFPLCSSLAELKPDSRKVLFEILLTIVENIPARKPRLHTLNPPRRGTCLNRIQARPRSQLASG